MLNSLGPLWSFTGPFLKDALGGGGGVDGFKHIMQHIGPAAEVWLKDMSDNSYEYNEQNLEILCRSVEEMLAGVDIRKLDNNRNKLMIDLFKTKAAASDLI
jgi:3-hydroxyacyl-CoA dehydrogenase